MADLSDDRITLMGLLFEAGAVVQRATTPTLETSGLSGQWFEALMRLARSPEHRLRMSDLAASMTSITPSGLTRLVDRLESEGLVARTQCPTDRRSSYAVLTDQGLRRVDEVLPMHLDDIERSVTSLFNDQERVVFEEYLRRVRDAGCPDALRIRDACDEALAADEV